MKEIRTALSSYGMSSRVFHGPLLEVHPGFKITRILERKANHSAGRHKGAVLVRNYGEILSDPEIDLVIVNTPDGLHTEMTRQALEAGKHVVVEKPFTLKTSEADELIALAEKQGRLLSVFQNRRWDSDFLTVRDIIEKGKLGRLVDYESRFDRYRNHLKQNWKELDIDTGTIYNLGAHTIDQALVLFGMPERVFCDSRTLREGANNDDSFDLYLHYQGFKCHLHSSYLVREPAPRFTLHGTHGSFRIWGQDPQEPALDAGKKPVGASWGLDPENQWADIHTDFEGRHLKGKAGIIAGNYSSYYDNLHEALHGKAGLEVTAFQAREVIRVIEAAYESSRHARVVNL